MKTIQRTGPALMWLGVAACLVLLGWLAWRGFTERRGPTKVKVSTGPIASITIPGDYSLREVSLAPIHLSLEGRSAQTVTVTVAEADGPLAASMNQGTLPLAGWKEGNVNGIGYKMLRTPTETTLIAPSMRLLIHAAGPWNEEEARAWLLWFQPRPQPAPEATGQQ